MATLLQIERVKYKCSCGVFSPVCKLFFCKYCKELKCKLCLAHELENHFCPSCLEAMPPTEARLKHNRCHSCFICPCCCGSILSPRATSFQTPNPDDPDKPIVKKLYYMVCAFCRWSTRDAGIQDKTVASGGWEARACKYAEEYNAAIEYYKQLGVEEKVEQEKLQLSRRRAHLNYKDLLMRKRSSLISKLQPLDILAPDVSTDLAPGQFQSEQIRPKREASAEVESLPDSYWSQPLNLNAVATLNQQLQDPEFQSAGVADFYPLNKSLIIKKAFRCKGCEHNLFKPEYIPVSIKFKLAYFATNFTPEIRLAKEPILLPGRDCEVLLSLSNNLERPRTVRLRPVDPEQDERAVGGNVVLDTPPCDLLLAACDAAADLTDDLQDTPTTFNDDPKYIAFRKGYKIHARCSCKPSLSSGTLVCYVILEYEHVTTTIVHSVTEPQQSEPVPMETLVRIELGALPVC